MAARAIAVFCGCLFVFAMPTTEAQAASLLEVSLTPQAISAPVGGKVVFTATITNRGDSPVTNMLVRFGWRSFYLGRSGAAVASSPDACTAAIPGQGDDYLISCTRADLAVGASTTITMTLNALAAAGSDYMGLAVTSDASSTVAPPALIGSEVTVTAAAIETRYLVQNYLFGGALGNHVNLDRNRDSRILLAREANIVKLRQNADGTSQQVRFGYLRLLRVIDQLRGNHADGSVTRAEVSLWIARFDLNHDRALNSAEFARFTKATSALITQTPIH